MPATTSATVQRLCQVVVDPVCGTHVQSAILKGYLREAVRLVHGETHYLFCSDLCRRHFELSPREFLKAS